MQKGFIAFALATAVAITGFSAVPAKADRSDVARALIGVAVVAGIASALDNGNDPDRFLGVTRSHYEPRSYREDRYRHREAYRHHGYRHQGYRDHRHGPRYNHGHRHRPHAYHHKRGHRYHPHAYRPYAHPGRHRQYSGPHRGYGWYRYDR